MSVIQDDCKFVKIASYSFGFFEILALKD